MGYNPTMILVYYYVFMNILTFVIYGVDKHKAKEGKWRIPERTLILLAVFGGFAGALAGMLIWHHKTRKKKFYITIPVLTVINIIFIIFCLYQNYHLTVSRYEVDIGLHRELKIVQISDLHNQFFGFGESVLLNRISELKPDIIAVTGDVVDGHHTSYSIAEDFFEGAVKIAPVYYITGNHEARLMGSAKYDEFIGRLKSLGVILLDDTYIDCGDYIIAGIADISMWNFGAYDLSSESKPVIMLAHDPGGNEVYRNAGADVVLTGHIHGGQIIIPGKGGLLSPDIEFFPQYYSGVYDIGDMKMVVSRGLGNSALPVRINDYPEIVEVIVK